MIYYTSGLCNHCSLGKSSGVYYKSLLVLMLAKLGQGRMTSTDSREAVLETKL
jgi:hypothetical protein